MFDYLFALSLSSLPLSLSAPVIMEFPEATQAVEGEELYFKVHVNGIPVPTIVWTFNKVAITSDYSKEIADCGG